MSCKYLHRRYRSCTTHWGRVPGGTDRSGTYMHAHAHEVLPSAPMISSPPGRRVPSPSIPWTTVMTYLQSLRSDPTIASEATRTIASILAERAGHDGEPLPSDVVADLWSLILDSPGQFASSISSVLMAASPDDRRTCWDTLRRRYEHQDVPRFAFLCSFVPPSLIPEVVSVMDSLSRHTVRSVRTTAITTLRGWIGDTDPDVRAQAVAILTDRLIGADRETDAAVRIRAAVTLPDPDFYRVVEHIDLRDVYWFCQSDTSSLGETVFDLIQRYPPWWNDPSFFPTMGSVLCDHPWMQQRSRAASLLVHIARMGSPVLAYRSIQTLWAVVVNRRVHHEGRAIAARALRAGMEREPTATMIRTVLLRDRDRIRTLPDPVLKDLFRPGMSWLLCGVFGDVVRALARDGRTDVVCHLLEHAWGHGTDADILDFITTNQSIVSTHTNWVRVLVRGLTSSVGEQVWKIIRQHVSSSAYHHLVVRIASGLTGDSARLPPSVITTISHVVREQPSIATKEILRCLWMNDPDHARVVTEHILRQPYPSADSIRSLALVWGYGMDHDIAGALIQWFHTVSMPQSNKDDIAYAIMATATDGCGHGDPTVLTQVLAHVVRRASPDMRRAMAKRLRGMWGRGDDGLVVHTLRDLARRPALGVLGTVAEALHQGWGRGYDADIVATLRMVLATTAKKGTADRRYLFDMESAIRALERGWGYGQDHDIQAMITTLVDRDLRRLVTLQDSLRYRLIGACARVILAGTTGIGEHEQRRLINALGSITTDARRAINEEIVRWSTEQHT